MPDIAGLKLIVPTSVAGSGVSVSASGKVTFTAATTMNINGCFTSTYDNYLIVMRSTASTYVDIRMRLRVGGTDATGVNYAYQLLQADSTSVSAARNAANDFLRIADGSSTQRDGTHIYMYGPALAQPTAARSVYVLGYLNAALGAHAGTHSLSTAYDGMTLYPSSGNFTGALTIYGLAN
jgi:hypothetical protein